MSVDNLTALRARDDLLAVVAAWGWLRARLRPGKGEGVHVASESGPPLDVYVSDLMREVEDWARFYGQVLIEETNDFVPTTSTMPGLLESVARRYGHFTQAEDRIALDFCDVAHELERKVSWLLNQSPPPRWVGPCPQCEGELMQRPGQVDAKCKECDYLMGGSEWRQMMHDAFESRLMTWLDIKSALFVTGHEVPDETIKTWIKRGRLQAVPHNPDLYRFKDAWFLAEQRVSRRRKTA